MKSIPTFLGPHHHLSSIQDVCHKAAHKFTSITTNKDKPHSPRAQKRKVCKQPSFRKILSLMFNESKKQFNFIVEKGITSSQNKQAD